ncbi:acylphosphatase-1 [Pelodytes ibericus]
MADGDQLISLDYEVFGKVQGVFFRKYTKAQGESLGLVGWVQNTDTGTVKGQLQGPSSQIWEMQQWLQNTGSPKSKITKVHFQNEKKITRLDHSSFKICK